MKKNNIKKAIKASILIQVIVATTVLFSACNKTIAKNESVELIVLDEKTRILCIGNSVTAGHTLANPKTQSWPAQLASMLGVKYSVLNCAVSGTTMLKQAKSSYWNTSEFIKAKNFDPQILIITLGTNDAHPNNWVYKDDFYNDYVDMIDSFRKNGKKPIIYICYPVTCYSGTTQPSNLQNEIIPFITQISAAKGVSIIDLNTPTKNQRNKLYNDDLHPNEAGAFLLAKTVFNKLVTN